MSSPIQIAYVLGFPTFLYESRALKSAAYDVSGRLTNILTVPGNTELGDSYFIKLKIVFPGTSNLNASATTLTFVLAVPGTSNLTTENKFELFFDV